MIKSGGKPEEYREIKTFYLPRLVDFKLMHHHDKQEIFDLSWSYPEDLTEVIENGFNNNSLGRRHYDTITYSNGMKKNGPRFVIEYKALEIRTGKPEWGAKEGVKYFVLNLGKIIK